LPVGAAVAYDSRQHAPLVGRASSRRRSLAPAVVSAQTTFVVTDEGALRSALTAAQNGDTIVFGNTITLTTGDLPTVQRSITIDGGGFSHPRPRRPEE
jgi:hypothetical protein